MIDQKYQTQHSILQDFSHLVVHGRAGADSIQQKHRKTPKVFTCPFDQSIKPNTQYSKPSVMWQCRGCWRRLTLIAFSKKTESINLPDEVHHACPPSKSKTNNKYPHHYECVEHIYYCPAWEEEGKFLSSVLHFSIQISLTWFAYNLVLPRLKYMSCSMIL